MFLAVDGQPDCLIENEGFIYLMSTLRPRYSLPVRKTVRNQSYIMYLACGLLRLDAFPLVRHVWLSEGEVALSGRVMSGISPSPTLFGPIACAIPTLCLRYDHLCSLKCC